MIEPFQQSGQLKLEITRWKKLNSRLRAGFSTRNGGVSTEPFHTLNLGLHVPDNQDNVVANRKKLAEDIEINLTSWVAGEQIHKTNVQVVENDDQGKGAEHYETSVQGTDGLITNQNGVLCIAAYADCVPLFFFDPSTGYTGIAHAGWKGTVHQIGKELTDTFKKLGTDVAELLVVIGPCISRDHYEVDENVIKHIPKRYFDKVATPKANNHYLLDLKQLNVEILLEQGILPENIDVTGYCTFTDESLFFSHRRDNGRTGRMLGYIGYTD
ncbi:peptidoglycan editing factor PgeF [Virgibacillus kekensis]|uniref:Purine nucleoside phosphorylase n=1 Tax=Virgibacillus kekensis TaxID=202261 RepID=A0ABV9DDZ2_9BACI